jgi:hypothetical protein
VPEQRDFAHHPRRKRHLDLEDGGLWIRSVDTPVGSLKAGPGAILDLLRLLNWPLKLAFFVGRWIYVTFFVDEDREQPPPG